MTISTAPTAILNAIADLILWLGWTAVAFAAGRRFQRRMDAKASTAGKLRNPANDH